MLKSCNLMTFVLYVTRTEAALAHPFRLHLALTAVRVALHIIITSEGGHLQG